MASSSPASSDFLRSNPEDDKKSTYSDQDYITYKYTKALISRPFVYEYFSTTFEDTAIAHAYKRFLEFIEKHPEPGKTELTALVYPIFVHFYLMLVQNSERFGKRSSAEKFYELYCGLFAVDEGYKDAVNELLKLKSVDDVKKHHYFKNFWEMKYILKLSYDVIKNLKSFVEDEECKALLSVLRFHFQYEDLEDIPVALKKSERDNEGLDSYIQLNMKLSNVFMSQLVIKNIIDVSSVDINDDETEICLALSRPFILTNKLERISEEPRKKKIHSVDCPKEGLLDFQKKTSVELNTLKEIPLNEHVYIVKYVPGVHNLVLVSSGTAVKLLNTETGDILSEFQNVHTNSILDIDIYMSSSAIHFATASKDSTVCLWNLNVVEVIRQYKGHADSINVVRFHPNGIYFATGGFDCTVRVWDLENEVYIRIYHKHEVGVHCLSFAPDGKVLVSSDAIGVIILWNLEDDSIISKTSCYETFEPNLARVTSLSFNPDGSILAACNFKGIIRFFDVHDRSVRHYETKYIQYVPLLIKCNTDNVWIFIMKEDM